MVIFIVVSPSSMEFKNISDHRNITKISKLILFIRDLFFIHKGAAIWGFAVVEAISERRTSMGRLSSYKVGACKIMPAVPTNTARVNIQRKSLSSTIATYFQSSFTWNRNYTILQYHTYNLKPERKWFQRNERNSFPMTQNSVLVVF